MSKNRLSPKHLEFIEAYLRTGNASEAARVAGFRGKPNVVGPRLLASVSIAQELSRHIREASEKVQISAQDALRAVKRVIEFDIRDLVDENGVRRKVSDLPEHVAKSLDFEVGKEGITYRLSRGQQITNAAKIAGILKEKVDVTLGVGSLAERIRKASKRVGGES